MKTLILGYFILFSFSISKAIKTPHLNRLCTVTKSINQHARIHGKTVWFNKTTHLLNSWIQNKGKIHPYLVRTLFLFLRLFFLSLLLELRQPFPLHFLRTHVKQLSNKTKEKNIWNWEYQTQKQTRTNECGIKVRQVHPCLILEEMEEIKRKYHLHMTQRNHTYMILKLLCATSSHTNKLHISFSFPFLHFPGNQKEFYRFFSF